jgi:nucleoside-diphosphate-sugar epimerase
MRIFLTGATGFIGSAITQELIRSGHQVLGLARSDAAAKALIAAGAEVHHGDLNDLASLSAGAAASDGVIHTGFVHDFSRFKEVCELDRNAIAALGEGLAGSKRALVITSGTALVSPGKLAMETTPTTSVSNVHPRIASEESAHAVAESGVRVSVLRLSPSVHGAGDHGFIPMLINIAREKGISVYVDEGLNRWSAVHRLDAAQLYRLAFEKAAPGATYHGVAEEGIHFRDIATAIGQHLNLPVVSKSAEEAAEHFGWFSAFAGLDCPASGTLTQEGLNWHPNQSTLLADLEQGGYFTS